MRTFPAAAIIRVRAGCRLLVLVFLALSCFVALAQEPSPPATQLNYEVLAGIGRCREVKCLDAFRQQVGNNKVAKIVYYEKWMLLQPSRIAGEGLLHNMPESEAEQLEMMALADSHGDATRSKEDTANLAEIYENWPHSVADAAIALPQYLPEYIRYGLLAPNDSHSDYTGNEERVCRADKARFLDAFMRLDRKTQAHLRKSVFDPEKCRALFFAEGN